MDALILAAGRGTRMGGIDTPKCLLDIGGLSIIQKPLGEEEFRAIFIKETATIIINSDFPTVKKFKSEGKYNNPHFILYLREVALTELAIAVTQILDQKPEYSIDTQTALTELRLRINDYSLKFHGI